MTFEFLRCPECGFAFVENPWTEYQEIYSEDYYQGRGADPFIDYVFELEHSGKSVRRSEWEGILELVQSCMPVNRATRWLDFGCGNGGLVRYCRETVGADVLGYEEGWIRDKAVKAGIPVLNGNELRRYAGTFDVVTSIEVLEHVLDPISELRKIRSLLKPGGLFFFTTANAAPFQSRLLDWHYALPEIHISFYEPRTLELALSKAGFRPEFRGFMPGYDKIIRFKTLKTLGIRRTSRFQGLIPWRLLSRAINWRRQITALPVGWAQPTNLST